ncbi:GNAT family N-acetyltransferase [Pedobacter cryoconitis]|uniref:Ribosomal protein S18 acetylase RimI-like enzyme n=1 Tax=Pedobacter cryoconitis TaxID=188932 RepID=A0A7X0J3K9_9SPHI|nr:GNAT family N-acetyltransferase [Pedobacter cryoconitis]MBB6499152.1 ribosomal protein S18 acetylase RimI-like enzyme [Pedobacter cryoconitis]
MKNTHALDNPIWHSLNSVHQKFALGGKTILRYPSSVLPFMGFDHADQSPLDKIENQMEVNEKVFVVGKLPSFPPNWTIFSEMVCNQMVCQKPVSFIRSEEYEITPLTPECADEMVAFINRIQPGYFKRDTPLLGNYYGIRINGQLIAMAGERLKMPGYSEVSAICTAPEYTGKGLAQYLISYICNEIQKRGESPFLHVVNTNERAIRLYEFMGFEKRADIPFWLIGLMSPSFSHLPATKE